MIADRQFRPRSLRPPATKLEMGDRKTTRQRSKISSLVKSITKHNITRKQIALRINVSAQFLGALLSEKKKCPETRLVEIQRAIAEITAEQETVVVHTPNAEFV